MPCRCPWNLRCFLLLLLLAGGSGLAQDATQTYTVHGLVLNSLTHQPIARALVEEQSDAALTDSNGRFELQLPAQMVTITARRPGFDAQADGVRTIQVSANTPELTFELNPQALITGRLELPDEAEASGIQIMAYRARMRHGARTWEFTGTTVARSDGSFRLVPSQVGTFLLRTSPLTETNGRTGNNTEDAARVFGYPSTTYPAAAQPSSEGGIKVAPGQQVNVNMVVPRQEFYRVAIPVRGMPDGVPPGLQLLGEDGTPLQVSMQWNAQNRYASARLPDGQYSIVAEVNGQTSLFGRTDFQVNGGQPAGVSVTVLPLLPIPVNVHRNFVETTTPHGFDRVENTSLAPAVDNPGISINLEPVDGQPRGANLAQLPGGSADRSSLQLTGAQPGRYWAQVFAQEGYVSAITSGGVDLAREPLVVGPGGASPPIEITVRNDSGQIGCTPRSTALQAAAGGASRMIFAYAIPQQPTTQQVPQTATPLNVEAVITLVPPGTYRVIAVDQSIDIDDASKEDMERYLSKAQSVAVAAGSKATVRLSVSHVSEPSYNTDDDSVPD